MQQVIENFLFYGRAADATIFMALSSIEYAQAASTEYTLKITHQFLNYFVTHPDAILTYSTSDMVLEVHSGTYYLREPNTRRRVGRHFFLVGYTRKSTINVAILNTSRIIKVVMTSAAEVELGALLNNALEAVPQKNTLE